MAPYVDLWKPAQEAVLAHKASWLYRVATYFVYLQPHGSAL